MVKDYVGTLRMGHVGTTASENAPHDTDTAMSVCAIVKIVLKKDMPGEPASKKERFLRAQSQLVLSWHTIGPNFRFDMSLFVEPWSRYRRKIGTSPWVDKIPIDSRKEPY